LYGCLLEQINNDDDDEDGCTELVYQPAKMFSSDVVKIEEKWLIKIFIVGHVCRFNVI